MRVLFAVAVAGSCTSLVACGGRFEGPPAPAPMADAGLERPAPAAPVDAALPDPPPTPFSMGGPDASGPVVCVPGFVQNFSPVWRALPSPARGTCTGAQITAGIAACFGTNATHASCKAWRQMGDSASCIECLVGSSGGHTWTPVIEISGSSSDPQDAAEIINVGACIALQGPADQACAEAVQGVFVCDLQSCLALCPMPTAATPNATLDVLQGCFQETDQSYCSTYAALAAACQADAGAASFCYDAPTNDTALAQYFTQACGPGAGDAGEDGG